MDQVKFYLKQAVKYRFWIAIALANLLAIIAAFVGIGPVQAEAQKLTKSIDDSYKDVQKYSGGGVPNDQYKPIVDEKKAILSKDVNKTWEKLYARQAPLLTWPEIVNENFQEWGRKYPETVDKALVQKTINDYVLEYPNDVEQVYQIFRPFDPVTGKGVVLAPAKEDLLRPAVFDESKLPTLGKIWAAKERLWIQSTLLDVVASVNSKAKDWDGAIIKQINLLEVGNSLAQDQRSIAQGETLEEAPELYAPGEEEAAAAAAPGAGGGGPGMEGMAGMAGMYMGAGGRGGAAGGDSNKVFYIKPATENNQYKILPVQMSVLCDQTRVQDFLVALENSPMSIQVMEIEVFKPAQRVAKPEKGVEQSFSGYGGYAGGMGGMMGMGEMPGMGRMGMGGMAGMPGMGGRMGGGPGMGAEGGMPGMMGGYGGGGMSQAPKGKAADAKRKDNREEREKLAKKNQRQIQDPYYNIVEVVVYGRARFYNPPPKEEVPADSLAPEMPAETPVAAEGDKPAATPAETPVAAEGTKPEGTPAAEGTPAPEGTKPAEPAAEAPKAEAPKGAEPSTEAPKTEEPKAVEPRAEAPKPEEPKI